MSKLLAMMMRKQQYMDLSVVGSPTINNGVVSGFSDSDYLTSDIVLGGDYIESEICFTTGSSILPNVTQVVITSDLYGIVIASTIKTWDREISAYRDIVPSNDLSVNTKYKIKFVKNGNDFKF